MMRPPGGPRYSPPRQTKAVQGPGTVPKPRPLGKGGNHKPAKGSSPRPSK